MAALEPTNPAWSDSEDPAHDAAAARSFDVRVLPDEHGRRRRRLIWRRRRLVLRLTDPEPTRIVLDGACPRCRHPMTSVHPVHGALSQEASAARMTGEGSHTDAYRYRLIATTCSCVHPHKHAPEGQHGCGAPFAVGVRWGRRRPGKAKLLLAHATRFERDEERALQQTLAAQVEQVRKAAESWRTGLGAFLGVLVVVFFVKGKTSFDAIADNRRWIVGGLLVLTAATALYAAYRAVRAAYGTPADEYTPGSGRLWRRLRARLPPTTPRHIHDYQSVGAWRDALAGQSVTDLRHAKTATVVSAIAFVVATVLTWSGSPPTRVIVTFSDAAGTPRSLCGKTAARAGSLLRVDGVENSSSPTSIPIERVASITPVATCPTR